MTKQRFSPSEFFKSPELWLLLVAAATRLIPHPPNFTPIGAMALFAGATMRWPFVMAFGAMLLSDAVLGFHGSMPWVYGALAIYVWLGVRNRERSGAPLFTGLAVAGSVAFFVITNFGVWLTSGLYERSAAGLVACFVAAVPFYGNTLASDLVFTGALFGVLKVTKTMVGSRNEPRTEAPPSP